MPRRSSGGSKSSFGGSKYSSFGGGGYSSSPSWQSDRYRSPSWKPNPTPSPSPKKVSQAPPPAPVHVQDKSIGESLADGLAFGVGSAVAHRAVDAVIGPRTVQHKGVGSRPAPTAAGSSMGDACGDQMKALQDCISINGIDIAKCQFYVDMWTECKRTPGSTKGPFLK